MNLGALHPMAGVNLAGQGLLVQRRKKAGPAAAGIKLGSGIKQQLYKSGMDWFSACR